MANSIAITYEAKDVAKEICEEMGCTQVSFISKLVMDYQEKRTGCISEAKFEKPIKHNPMAYEHNTNRLKKMSGSKTFDEIRDRLEINDKMLYSILKFLIRKNKWKLEKLRVVGPKFIIKLNSDQFSKLYVMLPKYVTDSLGF